MNEHIDVRGNHSDIIRKIATDSITLLKNTNGALPLQYGAKRVGVFGSDAQNLALGPNSCASWIPGSFLCADTNLNNGTNYIGLSLPINTNPADKCVQAGDLALLDSLSLSTRSLPCNPKQLYPAASSTMQRLIPTTLQLMPQSPSLTLALFSLRYGCTAKC